MALALKYRPQKLSDLYGHEYIEKTLSNALKKKKIFHGYLFFGPRGVGKTSTARILAKSLNCEKGITPDICLSCTPCKEIAEGIFPDVLELDAASNRGIDAIREIIQNTQFTPLRGRYKVYIIDEVHMLTTEAVNALLKTLEEPPRHVVFILATTEYHRVPETIRSRVQIFYFRPLEASIILSRLREIVEKEKISYEEKALSLIAESAEGSLRDAISLLEQILTYSGKVEEEDALLFLQRVSIEKIAQFIFSLLGKKEEETLRSLYDLLQSGVSPREILWQVISFLKECIYIKKGVKVALSLPQDMKEKIEEEVSSWDFYEMEVVWEDFLRLYERWGLYQIHRFSEQQALLEVKTWEILQKIQGPSVEEILEKISLKEEKREEKKEEKIEEKKEDISSLLQREFLGEEVEGEFPSLFSHLSKKKS